MQPFDQTLRRLMLWLALLPFLALSLLGTGVMPERSDSGAIILVICTDAGMVEMAFDPVTMQPIDDAGEDDLPDHDPCDWAAAQPAFALVVLPDLIVPVAFRASQTPPSASTIRMVAAATGLPPATGPPALL
ncbi:MULTISPECIES: hypothetical protein [unclassified Yoonia]|uniref:hypothetical protein n=1 Tax=unclassified Yoonia TaxID=2629118 RepID=UPI002AFDEC9E|nr:MULTISPECIES: hypothetical protein [unclassified Yoonia]